ncbi:PREDICTED: solute carrier family 35 member C2-like isoform X2 [Acropora digitifera]|uniref:solute carrier family 35 member C2-like isoform X2 n=1 Tax=Acropora digitifera TaxID=70779 RepID=UPI00077AA485|nr:PREDICTED: solute carrier family 35 member C2-like isoform X2 [Acropora digitifera]
MLFYMLFFFLMFMCYSSLEFYNRCLLQTFHSLLSASLAHYAIVALSATFLRLLWVILTDRIFPDWSCYLKNELPMVIGWALDIVCSIWNLVYITLLSLSPATTSESLMWIVIMFVIAFGLQWHDISQTFVRFTCQLLLFTFMSMESNVEGFVFALFVSGLSSLHWTIVQVLTQKHESTSQFSGVNISGYLPMKTPLQTQLARRTPKSLQQRSQVKLHLLDRKESLMKILRRFWDPRNVFFLPNGRMQGLTGRTSVPV